MRARRRLVHEGTGDLGDRPHHLQAREAHRRRAGERGREEGIEAPGEGAGGAGAEHTCSQLDVTLAPEALDRLRGKRVRSVELGLERRASAEPEARAGAAPRPSRQCGRPVVVGEREVPVPPLLVAGGPLLVDALARGIGFVEEGEGADSFGFGHGALLSFRRCMTARSIPTRELTASEPNSAR